MDKEHEVIFDAPLNKCLFCESKNIKPWDIDFTKKTIYKCFNCGIKFLNPQYSDKYLQNYYEHCIGVEINESRKKQLYEGNNFYLSLIERYCAIGRFLSIGCGEGIELKVAEERGWQVEGYDIDPQTVKKLSEKFKIKIFSGDFLKLKLLSNHYDCVYLNQVIEHLKNPQDYLKSVEKILKPNGILFIASPNVELVSDYFKTLLGKAGFKKNKRGKHYSTGHHIIYYTPRTLRNILENYFNFKVVLIRNGYKVRRNQSKLESVVKKNILHILPWSSTFLIIAKNKKSIIPQNSTNKMRKPRIC